MAAPPGVERTDAKLGNLAEIEAAGNLHNFAAELHKKHGPVASFWFGERYVVSTASPEGFEPQEKLFDRPNVFFENFKALLGAESVQYKNGEEGKKLHDLIAKAYTQEACENYIPLFIEVTETMAEEWGKKDCQKIPLKKNMMKLALQSLMSTCFGDDFKCCNSCDLFERNFDEAISLMEKYVANQAEQLSPEFNTSVDLMRKKICGIVAGRKAPNPKLLIDHLIEASPSDDWLFSNAITNIVAGFRTTGNLLSWIVFYLTLHPGIQEEVYKELVQVLGLDGVISGEKIPQLKTTRAVIKEAIRLSVVAGYSGRVSTEDLDIAGFRVPAGTPILQSLGVALQDEKQWTEPDKFDPSRFLAEDSPNLHSVKCPAFGFAGGRECPAIPFVFTEVATILSVLLRKFRLHLCEPGFMFATENGCVAHPIEEILVVPCARHPQED